MLHFLPSAILGSLTFSLVALNTVFWGIPIHIIAFLKFIVPISSWRQMWTQALIRTIEAWVWVNNVTFWLTQKIKWDISGLDGLNQKSWYLVSSNHQSWLDILVLFHVFTQRIPLLRFFLKQELLWVPVVGAACWALDFPFMKRYSREFLQKHPELRGKDLETTRQACERFKKTPVSVINFWEGTRFTLKKHARQKSPYGHLLRPKAGGLAFTLAAMGEYFDTILDVTIIYPDKPASFWNFLSGRMLHIVVRVQQVAIPPELLAGDYMNDPAFREQFQVWVRDLWQDKDALIEQTLQGVDEAV
jgi:1-acyl-sn-glycerol-3-phosphate acyltransferase